MKNQRRVTIYQPRYFPQLHYLNRILSSDIFVILDSAQYTKSLVHATDHGRRRHSSYQSDTPIKTASGTYMLTVPVRHAGVRPLNQTSLVYTDNWSMRQCATIRTSYGKAPYFDVLLPGLEAILKYRYETLADLNIATISWALSALCGIPDAHDLSLKSVNQMLTTKPKVRLKRILRDQETGVTRPVGNQKGTEWTIALCQAVGATEYIYGGTAREGYMDLSVYQKSSIHTVEQNWRCPIYPQLFTGTAGFEANLSIIDLVMNVKCEEALKILTTL